MIDKDGQVMFDTGGVDDDYEAFLEKFKPKKTTDDCYTPPEVYELVAAWCEAEYGVRRDQFLRPFYPGGNYQAEEYPGDCVVVDNPPFSILAQIVDWYASRSIRFFLFAPALTLFSNSGTRSGVCAIACGASVIYENGAVVNTSFITNLEDSSIVVRTAPELRQQIDAAVLRLKKEEAKDLPKYTYPSQIFTASMGNRMSKYGQDFRIYRKNALFVRALDNQRANGKAIFGGGFLLSNQAAAEKAAAEKAAAEKAAAIEWKLSARELSLLASLEDDEK